MRRDSDREARSTLLHFSPHTHPLTVVSDRDGLLADEEILAALAERGFALIDEPDPIRLRHRVEEARLSSSASCGCTHPPGCTHPAHIAACQVVREAPCGNTRYVASRLAGTAVDRAVEQARLLHHYYPCWGGMDADPVHNTHTLLHIAATMSQKAVERALENAGDPEMTNTDPQVTQRQIAEIKQRLADARSRIPKHDIPAPLMAEIDELEQELARLEAS